MDRWQTQVVICEGGLIEDQAALLLGTVKEGAATTLINYEPALEGGYARVAGYTKYDDSAVPGLSTSPILGTIPAFGGVLAARENVAETSVDVYFSTGSGWGSKINTANRSTSAAKYRMNRYSLTEEVVILTDGFSPALKYNGTTDTLINGTGAPTAPKYSELFSGRLALAPASTDSSVALSSATSDTDFDGVNGAIEINVGDRVTGLKTFRNELYIFCENSIFKITGNTSATFSLQAVTRSIGCLSEDTIQELGGDLIYLAPDGLRSIAATANIGDIDLGLLSRAIQPSIRQKLNTNPSEDAFTSTVIRKKSQYRLHVYDSSISDEDATGFLGKLSGAASGIGYEWAKLQGINVYSAGSQYDSSTEVTVFGHPSNGYVYLLESGSDFDGTAVSSVYESPDITFDEPDLRKVLYKVAVNMQVAGELDVSLNLLFDNKSEDILQPGPIVITQLGEVPTYGTAIYSTSVYGSLTLPTFRKNLVGSGYTASFRFASTNNDPVHRIDSYTIQYALKGRR